MATYASFHATFYIQNRRVPTEAEVFDAGVREGMRRLNEGDHPRGYYTRSEVQKWRNDMVIACADIARRYDVNPYCIEDLLRMSNPQAQFDPRYSVKHQMPVAPLLFTAADVPVEVWFEDRKEPLRVAYGNPFPGGKTVPHFFDPETKAVVTDVTHWAYVPEQNSPQV